MTSKLSKLIAILAIAFASATSPADYTVDWHTIDGGGATFSTGGGFELGGTIGQPDAGPTMNGGGYTLAGGFWGAAAPSGTGVPAAALTSSVSRKANSGGPGGVCDLPLIPSTNSDSRQGGVTQLRLTFNVAPGGPGVTPVTIQQATCAAPAYAPYSGASTVSASATGNTLVLTFTPGLENARKYKVTLGPTVTSIAGQFIEFRGLLGDVNSDGSVNALDRSVVVGAWTGGGGFSCLTDVNSNAATNALDRSIVVGAWTSLQNCAP